MIRPKFDGTLCTEPEGLMFETKECGNSFPTSFWETYSAFANTSGGTVALGIREMSYGLEVVGVKDPPKIIKEMWDAINNREKVSANILCESDIAGVDVEGKTIILINVPRASKDRRPVYINGSVENGTFKRNGEGDYHCSREEIDEMVRDAGSRSPDSVVISGLSIDDFEQSSIESFRNIMVSVRPGSRWNKEPRDEFLRLIGAADRGEDGIIRPTLAGLLMFGSDSDISRHLSGYLVDLRIYSGGDEWSERFVSGTGEWSGNLFDFFTEVNARLFVKTPKPFKLDGAVRVDDNEFMKAERELVLNGIVHADYYLSTGVRVLIHPDRLVVENPGTFRIPISKAGKGGISDPRNKNLMGMFRLIGMVENSGQGVKRIVDTCRELGIPDPEFLEETDPSRVICTLPMWDGVDRAVLTNRETKILEIMLRGGNETMTDMAKELGTSQSTVSRTVRSLQDKGLVRRESGKRGARWVVFGRQ